MPQRHRIWCKRVDLLEHVITVERLIFAPSLPIPYGASFCSLSIPLSLRQNALKLSFSSFPNLLPLGNRKDFRACHHLWIRLNERIFFRGFAHISL